MLHVEMLPRVPNRYEAQVFTHNELWNVSVRSKLAHEVIEAVPSSDVPVSD
jgi:hypothetical protein